MIDRPFYVNQLVSVKETRLIKVVTGVRRCGKSTLLELYRGHMLKNKVQENQIININLEDADYRNLLFSSCLNCAGTINH